MTHSLLLVLLLALSPQAAQTNPDWETVRGIAEAEYEILMMMIDKREWSGVAAKARALFSLPFPEEHELLKVDAAREYVDKLVHADQLKLAHEVLDAALAGISAPHHQADIYREKGFVCEKEGRNKEAVGFFEKSVELERKRP